MTDLFVAINVSLAILWADPGEKRPHDALVCGMPVEADSWADLMDDDMRLWLVGKVETQALYGERLQVIDHQGDWLKVCAVGQGTCRDKRGYPGWIPAVQVSSNSAYLAEQLTLPSITVIAPKTWVYRDSSAQHPILELSYQTRLPLLEESQSMVRVRLPDGNSGYLAKSAIIKTADITFHSESLIKEARRFLGLRYIWGGTSAYGFDCSGLAMRIYQSQNITIPRDADDQFQAGTPVSLEDLLPGDLLFFANRQERSIHHVGLYIGDGMMIHSPNSLAAIREETFTSGVYGEEFCGARRYR